MGGPEMAPPTPPSLVAPRRSRGAPRFVARRGRVAFDEVPLGVGSLRHFSVTFPGGLALAHPTETSATSAPVERVKEDSRMDVKSMDRRDFLKITGVAGSLAAQQAPAFGQGNTPAWVRWVAVIPEASAEL